MSDTDDVSERDAWLAAVEKVLAGRRFEDVLVSHTRGGLTVEPLYTGSGKGPETTAVRGSVDPDRLRHGWDIRQCHGGTDPGSVRDAILEDLENGVVSIELEAPDGGWTADRMAASLDGVLLDVAPVALAPHADTGAARALIGLWDQAGLGPGTVASLGLDPMGEWGRSGRDPDPADCAAFVVGQLSRWPRVTGLVVDVERYVDAGATEIQELAWGTATGIAYLRALAEAGLDVGLAARTIGFRWTASAEHFSTIAKLRAARRMWSRVLEVSGLDALDRDQYQQVVTPISMYSRLDPWVNLIRATTAALGAVVGGADSVTVRPFDQLVTRPDSTAGSGHTGRLGRRTARNTQILLREESHLGHSVDPAGGSWFIESLTDRMAEAAWAVVREIERGGGMGQHLSGGTVARELEADWEERLVALGTRREYMIGVNQFPYLPAEEGDRAEVEPGNDEPGGSSLAGPPQGGLPLRRPAEPFERLRDAADRLRAETGRRPSAHIAALGPLAVHGPRSTWAANLLGVGGVCALGADVDGADSPIAVEAAFAASGADVAVICGPDDLYATRGEAVALALKEAGARFVAMTGDPGDRRDALVSAGVDEFWQEGIDVLAALARLHHVLGVGRG